MKKKTEKAFFDEQWEGMLTQLKAFIETGDQEKLHQFRVQVKKLRAMLALLDAALSRNTLSKDFKPVKKIFRHGGDIRNAYMNLQLGIRYKLNNQQFTDSQQAVIENGINEFKVMGDSYLETVDKVYNAIQANLKAIGDRRINQFYKTHIEQIANTLSQLQFDETLHDCRKQIKILLYNRKIAQKALDGKLQVNNDYLNQLQDHIGDWHDNELAITLFLTPELNEKPVITRIKRQNTRLKKVIAILTKDFWKKATLYSEPSGKKHKEWVLR